MLLFRLWDMEKVIFIKINEVKEKLKNTLKEELKVFYEGEKIAIKLHMGEKGNKYYLKPELVKVVVETLKELKTKPFIFDSPAIYPGGRGTVEKYLKTAAEHGFTQESIGCPIIVSNEHITYKTQHLEAEVCKPLTEADGMLVLTHVKGHMCSGFGASIKNLGMGGLTIKSKTDIHTLPEPEFIGDCVGCGTCVKACPGGAIELKNNKAKFDYDSCWGCDICVEVCPSNVLKPKIASFDILLAEGAFAVIKSTKKSYFINVLKNITKLCDCASDPGAILVDDIGIVMSKDIITTDKASLDLINKKAGKDIFLEANKKSPLTHIKETQKLGLGNLNYKLIEK